MERIPVYFVPGLGANSKIFEFIELPETEYECIYFEWEVPADNESISEYAQRYCRKVTHDNPVLIGVSFGGFIVQEMAAQINVRQTIIISSVKSNREFPMLFNFARKTRIYKLVPTSLLVSIGKLARFPVFGRKINERLRLYRKYLGIREKKYWDWAIGQVLCWQRKEVDPRVIHIHGMRDEIFPAKYLKDFIPIDDGTHIMLIIRHKWLSENLPRIINGELRPSA